MTQVLVHTDAKTLIFKGYEERRYPSMNQACTEVKYKMPEQEEVEEEDGDEEEGSFKKVMKWLEISMKNMNKTENETDIKLYKDMKTGLKLHKYRSGVNKKGQEIEITSPEIFTMKREKVSFTYNNAVLTNIIPMS